VREVAEPPPLNVGIFPFGAGTAPNVWCFQLAGSRANRSFIGKGNEHEDNYACRSAPDRNNGLRNGPDRHVTGYFFKWCFELWSVLGRQLQSGSVQIRIQYVLVRRQYGQRLERRFDRRYVGCGFIGRRIRQRPSGRNAELLIQITQAWGLMVPTFCSQPRWRACLIEELEYRRHIADFLARSRRCSADVVEYLAVLQSVVS
jgi:hypothetical protein